MSIPNQANARFTEHEKYAEFLASLNRAEMTFYLEKRDDTKEAQFNTWLAKVEAAKDFKDLIPMHIRMNAEEWKWFTSRLEAEDSKKLPNLRALAKHPPKNFEDLV